MQAEGLFDYQGRAGNDFHCTVEPSPGHIRTLSVIVFFVFCVLCNENGAFSGSFRQVFDQQRCLGVVLPHLPVAKKFARFVFPDLSKTD